MGEINFGGQRPRFMNKKVNANGAVPEDDGGFKRSIPGAGPTGPVDANSLTAAAQPFVPRPNTFDSK